MSVAWVAVGATVVSGAYSASQQRSAGRDARIQGEQNAQSILDTALRNQEIQNEVADYNAGLTQAFYNSKARIIEETAQRNAELMTMEYEEELRRHIRGEVQLAGQIRSATAATGFQVNQGTPLIYMNNELDEAERERDYIETRGTLTVFNYLTEQQELADGARIEGQQKADQMRFNAAAEAEIYLNEQVGVSEATRAQGQSLYRQARSGSNATLIQTGVSVIGSIPTGD